MVQAAKQYSSDFDFNAVTATFHNAQRCMAHLICFKTKDDKSMEVECLILRSNSEDMLKFLKGLVNQMERYFAGLIRLKRDQRFSEKIAIKIAMPISVAVNEWKSAQPSLQVECTRCADSETDKTKIFVFDKSRVQASIRTRSTPSAGAEDPRCQHNISLLELLTTFRVLDLHDCPVCMGVGEMSPGLFSACECRL